VKALLATGSGDSTARIWNLIEHNSKTACQSIILTPTSEQPAASEEKLIITTLEWNPSGTLLAAGRSDGSCFVWDCKGRLVGSWKRHSASVFSIRWSPSGKWLVSGSEDSTVIVLAVSGAAGLLNGGDSEKIQIDSASESDNSLVAPMQIDSASSEEVNFTFHCSFNDHKGSVLDVDWEDEGTFASCSQDATIRIFSLASASLLATLEGHAKEINAIKWSPHSNLLCSCSDDETAKIWTVRHATAFEEGEVGGEESEKKNSQNPTLDPPSSRVKSYSLLHTLSGHTDGIYTVEWSPNSPSLVATASFDTTARLWNALEGTCLWVLAKHSKPVYSLAFSPDGLTLVTGAVDKNVYFWDTQRGRLMLAHPCKGGVYALGWSADGAGVAVCTAKSAAFLAVKEAVEAASK
jgi:transducin (beta)-like 1